MKNDLEKLVEKFNSSPQGASPWGEDQTYILIENSGEYLPFNFVKKNLKEIKTVSDLQKRGYQYSSLDYLEKADFKPWYKEHFGKKLDHKLAREIGILYLPHQKDILKALSLTDKAFQIFKTQNILMNGKNLPIQLGEWFAKSIFGLRQIKSSSQRGFDFYSNSDKRVEVKVHWNDFSSPKGVKIKKSLLELSDFAIVMYVSKNFMIRDILLLDSQYILRKFASKGHTVFLKDPDISKYFFSSSTKHFNKIIDRQTLMRFAHPNFAVKLSDKL